MATTIIWPQAVGRDLKEWCEDVCLSTVLSPYVIFIESVTSRAPRGAHAELYIDPLLIE
jgi:predicted Co/Zn/Cd cation transporter (cation efflux family)